MSTHDDVPAVAQDAEHDEHDDPAADEPRTPGWLPLLGGVLFLCGAFAFVATRGPGEKEADLTARAHAIAQRRIDAAKAAAAPAPPPQAPPSMPAPGGDAPRKGG